MGFSANTIVNISSMTRYSEQARIKTSINHRKYGESGSSGAEWIGLTCEEGEPALTHHAASVLVPRMNHHYTCEAVHKINCEPIVIVLCFEF